MSEDGASAKTDRVGSLAEEAARFAESLSVWARSREDRHEAMPGAHATADHVCDESTCRICPVCRGLELVRSARPEVYAHLSDAVASLLAAARELLADVAPPTDPPAHGIDVLHFDVE